MYKDALPKHQGEGSASNSGQSRTNNHINYNTVPFDYGNTIGCTTHSKDHVNMICVKGVDTQCTIITRRIHMKILGPMAPIPPQAQVSM